MLAFFSLFLVVGQMNPAAPPTDILAYDAPNDEGGKIVVEWQVSPDDTGSAIAGYEVHRSESVDGEYEYRGFAARGTSSYTDRVEDKTAHYYRVKVRGRLLGDSEFSQASQPATPSVQLFHTGRVNVLLGLVVFCLLVAFFTVSARRGKDLFVRKIAGLQAVEEAVGRATEMGRPILYVPGLSTPADVATIASINILSQVAKKTAQYDTRLIVPNRNAIVMSIAHEVVKEAHATVGRPDSFRSEDVFYVTDSQFGYAAAVNGIMVREKPATNFFLGMFWAESLILAETGASTGAIQIAGTDAITQLPFFIAACDYTLIGEELYAASAYLSREPKLLGSLKAQDWSKVIVTCLMVAGVVFTVLGYTFFQRLFEVE
jgi:hypothetical protein